MVVAWLAALTVVIGMLAAARLVRVRGGAEPSPYECGETPTGTAWRAMPLGFVSFALIFVLFDVELALIVPWFSADGDARGLARAPAIIFLATLCLGLVHAWRRGDLTWRR